MKPLKIIIGTATTGAATLALAASAFGVAPGGPTPHAQDHGAQSAHVATHQEADSNTGFNFAGNKFWQENWTKQRSNGDDGDGNSADSHNNATGSATISTGSASATNGATASVSQTHRKTIDNESDDNDAETLSSSNGGEKDGQSADVWTDQSASANSGGNVAGNKVGQSNGTDQRSNGDDSGSNDSTSSNTASGTASVTTGGASSSNTSNTSVTQSSTSTISNTSD